MRSPPAQAPVPPCRDKRPGLPNAGIAGRLEEDVRLEVEFSFAIWQLLVLVHSNILRCLSVTFKPAVWGNDMSISRLENVDFQLPG